MKIIRIMSVVGARPNFMKIAPFVHAIEAHNRRVQGAGQVAITSNLQPSASSRSAVIKHFLVHTGQHYDKAMSHSFFEALDIPPPDIDLGIGSGSHAEQVGRTMIEFEKVLLDWKPDWVVVVGDVNATCACSITAKKHHVRVAHIEAGLRSFDERMPEEINRMVTDSISDLLLTPDEFANANLRREGHAEDKIRFVGNIMIDTLEAHRDQAAILDVNEVIMSHRVISSYLKTENLKLENNTFSVLTMHRPSNVDTKHTLEPLVRLLVDEISAEMPMVWSVHPRTKKNLQAFGLWDELLVSSNVILINPVGYHEMLKLNMAGRIMLTDSGGLQEESCVLGTPCVTMRDTTERPVTLVKNGGLSELTGPDPDKIRAAFFRFNEAAGSTVPANECTAHIPPLWDGKTSGRIVECLVAGEA